MSYAGKRALDVVVAGSLLALSAPVLAAAAVLIRLESHGHPIYRQRRVGRDEEPFDIYKLRTMVAGAESIGPGLALAEGDARITRLDLAILWRTVRIVLGGDGLYKGESGGWRDPPAG